MINHEALRMYVRKYRKADSEIVRDMMETNLMRLLAAQSEFERVHQEFLADLLHQLRDKV
jgi:hypothetical protein